MADEFCGFTRSPCPIGTFEMMCEGTVSGGQLGATLQRAFAFYATQTRDLRFELHAYGELAAIELHAAHPHGADPGHVDVGLGQRSEEHTSELQSLMRISYAVFCLKNKTQKHHIKR